MVVNPPSPGDPSYDLFMKEKKDVLSTLAHKAKFTADMFNSVILQISLAASVCL